MTERTVTLAAYEGDIVSRLRNWRGLHLANGGDLFEEAADEIERLQKREKLWEATMTEMYGPCVRPEYEQSLEDATKKAMPKNSP